MSIWHAWSERRRWRKENKHVPLHQLRGTFYDDPKKQRWVRRWVWRREHLWGHPIRLAGLGVAIVGLIGKLYGLF